ncbi:MAG: hypothetical protein JWN89_286 [Parcubacteria group bacterium]|nr:hypothetical protein [Parcubacteria group bacterium]
METFSLSKALMRMRYAAPSLIAPALFSSITRIAPPNTLGYIITFVFVIIAALVWIFLHEYEGVHGKAMVMIVATESMIAWTGVRFTLPADAVPAFVRATIIVGIVAFIITLIRGKGRVLPFDDHPA